MTPVLENAVLKNDLDCRNFDILNVGYMIPVPDNALGIYDPRFYDGRTPPAGSVDNSTVNELAAIEQSKLNLNGVIPTAWSGAGENQAAAGNLVERIARKGAPSGYAGLDSNGKIEVASVDAGAAVGTITDIALVMPHPLNLNVHHITGSGTWNVYWKAAPAFSWFGSDGTIDFLHHELTLPFYVTDPFLEGFFAVSPDKFTTGEFSIDRLPVAHGVGMGHAQGLVPDPGLTGDPLMYLGRDMQWHYFVVTDPALVYQPDVPDVTIVLDWEDEDEIWITIRSTLAGSRLFYRVTPEGFTTLGFHEALHEETPHDVHISLKVNEHDLVEAFASKAGYKNSKVETWEVITPLTDLELT